MDETEKISKKACEIFENQLKPNWSKAVKEANYFVMEQERRNKELTKEGILRQELHEEIDKLEEKTLHALAESIGLR